MKTKLDFSIPIIIVILGLALFLPAFFSETFSQDIVGKIWMMITFILIFLGLLKIEQIHILGNTLVKTNFIFRRKIEISKIKHYKIKENNFNAYPQYNIAAILKMFKNGERYSNFRVLIIYPEGKRCLKIDERTMPTSDFKKLLSVIKIKIKAGKK